MKNYMLRRETRDYLILEIHVFSIVFCSYFMQQQNFMQNLVFISLILKFSRLKAKNSRLSIIYTIFLRK